ncbi:Lactosylceramide 4-alpha-galactosyltransferase, partial [Pseudolycoriella hygida]
MEMSVYTVHLYQYIAGETTSAALQLSSGMVRFLLSVFMKQHFKCKLLTALLLVVIVIITISLWADSSERLARKCFSNHVNIQEHNIQMLPDIMSASKIPTLGKSIFFHETSCADGIVSLNARQGCAIESAALANPEWDVFLLFASPVGFSNKTAKSAAISALELYPNVHFRNVNLWSYSMDTPISSFINGGQLFRSKYVNSHTSDFLRYLSLYKWGGTYLDLDVIVKQPFDKIKPNYAGAESEKFVAAGLINFDYKNVGHDIAEECLYEFVRGFDGDDWGNNGPGVITRVLQKRCLTTNPALMTRERCNSFNVFPVNKVYA